MKRSDNPYPHKTDFDNNPFCAFLSSAWANGWFDDYSDEHFLIKVIENRLTDFIGKEQLIENNLNQFNIIQNGTIDYSTFCDIFCVNFSTKMDALAQKFGKDPIKKFVIDQLSAGKNRYNEDAFFEALSEISILSFLSRISWTKYEYEPSLNYKETKKNPEARFEYKSEDEKFYVNVEVKSPAFPHNNHDNEKIVIPIILLSDNGRTELKKYCSDHCLTYLDPRARKLKDFLNSASDKFVKPIDNEYNLLYINWSYRDFPSNSYLEAWSLLTNPINGILTNPIYAKYLDVNLDIFDKISAIIVYTESLEGLMFQSFTHVWQSDIPGPRFRMWVNRKMYQNIDKTKYLNILHDITGMNPSKNHRNYICMCDFKGNCDSNINSDLLCIINNNPLIIE